MRRWRLQWLSLQHPVTTENAALYSAMFIYTTVLCLHAFFYEFTPKCHLWGNLLTGANCYTNSIMRNVIWRLALTNVYLFKLWNGYDLIQIWNRSQRFWCLFSPVCCSLPGLLSWSTSPKPQRRADRNTLISYGRPLPLLLPGDVSFFLFLATEKRFTKLLVGN